jgi:hypothetical protein
MAYAFPEVGMPSNAMANYSDLLEAPALHQADVAKVVAHVRQTIDKNGCEAGLALLKEHILARCMKISKEILNEFGYSAAAAACKDEELDELMEQIGAYYAAKASGAQEGGRKSRKARKARKSRKARKARKSRKTRRL